MHDKTIDAPRRRLTRRPPHAGGGRQLRTTICALLLSFAVAAGAATTTGDAFAQSNTDRLVGLVGTTDGNNAMLEAIRDMLGGLGEQIAAVQNAIAALTENVSALSERTADTAADVAGLAGKVDAANEGVAGLDGKADAVGMGVAGLAGKVDAATMHIDGVGAKVDAANMRINELAGTVDAASACAADLSARADAIQSNFADLSARAASVGTTADAVHREVEALKTAMAGHAGSNQLDPSYAERLDMIPSIRAALDALGERPDGTAALNEISDGIKANSARIAALEDTINGINSQIAGVAGKLGAVEAAVEQRVGPAPTNLHRGTEKYDITIGHFGDSAKGKAPGPEFTMLTVTHAFACKADVFVGRVTMDNISDILWTHTNLPRPSQVYSTATVEDRMLFHNRFETGGAQVVFRKALDFDLTELKAGGTLDFKSQWMMNHTNASGSVSVFRNSVSGVGNYIVANHGESIPAAKLPSYYTVGQWLLDPAAAPYTKAQLGAVKIYDVTVEYYSAAENAECSFQRTSGFSTGPTKEGQKVLSVRAGTGQLVNGFQEELDCNNLPTAITGVNTEVPGGLSLHQHSTFQLLSGSGDKEKVHSTFRFNPNGTIAHAGGDLPFTFEGAPLRINGTLAGAPGLLVVVDYKTTEDNSCR